MQYQDVLEDGGFLHLKALPSELHMPVIRIKSPKDMYVIADLIYHVDWGCM